MSEAKLRSSINYILNYFIIRTVVLKLRSSYYWVIQKHNINKVQCIMPFFMERLHQMFFLIHKYILGDCLIPQILFFFFFFSLEFHPLIWINAVYQRGLRLSLTVKIKFWLLVMWEVIYNYRTYYENFPVIIMLGKIKVNHSGKGEILN